MTKWQHLLKHFWPSLRGTFRLFFSHPLLGIPIILGRMRFFVNRTFSKPLDTPEGFVIQDIQQLLSYWAMFVERELWHQSWIRDIKRTKKPLILDVGANCGFFVELVWELNHDLRVIAFEPQPEMQSKLLQLRDRLGLNLDLRQIALSDISGTATLNLAAWPSTTASLTSYSETTKTIKVSLATLDSLGLDEEIFILKIDVDGPELNVLRGALQTLKKTKYVLVEILTEDSMREIREILGTEWQVTRVGVIDYLFSRL